MRSFKLSHGEQGSIDPQPAPYGGRSLEGPVGLEWSDNDSKGVNEVKTQEQIDREHERRERMGAIRDAAEALLNREFTRNYFGDYNAVDRWEVARFGESEDIVLVVTDCENWVNDGPLYELGLYSLGFLEGAEGCDEEWTTLMSGSAQDVTYLAGDGCIMFPDEMVDRIEAEVKVLMNGSAQEVLSTVSMGGEESAFISADGYGIKCSDATADRIEAEVKALYASGRQARLSSEFSRLVRRDAGTGAVLAAIIEKNKSIGPACCATHDYWDSNMTMAEAWDNIIKREMDGASEADACLWGAAWDTSKAAGFSN